jgi:uncharacterized spore protein YtfJ
MAMTGMTQERTTGSASETLERTLNQALSSVRADAVFGRPIERGATVVIPCAEVMVGMGMGVGRGSGPAVNGQNTGGGEGLGGGGAGRGRPVAVLVIGQDGVQVQPVLDVTRLVLAGMTTAGFMAFWLTRLVAGAGGRGRGKAKGGSPGQLMRALRS